MAVGTMISPIMGWQSPIHGNRTAIHPMNALVDSETHETSRKEYMKMV
jgi:hypothetical protein